MIIRNSMKEFIGWSKDYGKILNAIGKYSFSQALKECRNYMK